MFSLIKIEVIMFDRSWTVKEEIKIMGMEEEWDDIFVPDWEDEWNLDEYERHNRLLAEGYIVNPYYDDVHARWLEKHGREEDWTPINMSDYIRPEELEAQLERERVIALGWTFYERLLDEEEHEYEYMGTCL